MSYSWRLVRSIERRILARSLAVAGLLALLSGLALVLEPGVGGDVYVSNYDFNVSYGPVVGLEERIEYTVAAGEYRMLYRSWPWPTSPGPGTPVVLASITCPPGMVPYLVDSGGRVHVLGPISKEAYQDLQDAIEAAEAANEAGCYKPTPLPPGTHTVTYHWVIEPPSDAREGDAVIIPLAVEGEHIDYETIAGRILAGQATVAPAPLQDMLRPAEHGYILGPTWLDEKQGLHIAMGPEGSGAVEDYEAKARLAYHAATIIALAGALGAAAAPVLALVVYSRSGAEPPPRSPVPLGGVPETGEKPWMVNVLYHGEPGFAG